MAVYRQIQVSYWQDSFILDLTPEEKYFYLYLMTNSKTKQCGVYEIPKRVMELETGYNRETIDKLVKRFAEYGKIEYCEETKEMLLKNWFKYNSSKSPKVLQCIMSEVAKIKHLPFKIYTMDSLSIDSGEEKEKKEEKEKIYIPYKEIIEHLNLKAGTRYKHTTDSTKKHIHARWEEGHKLEDFIKVIDNKVVDWLNDKEYSKYLRPETLFGTKFESYLNKPSKPDNDNTPKEPTKTVIR